MDFIIISDGKFYTCLGMWSSEYPNAKLYPNFKVAKSDTKGLDTKRADDVEIWTTVDYAAGGRPIWTRKALDI